MKHVVCCAIGKCAKVIVSHRNSSWKGSREAQVRTELIAPLKKCGDRVKSTSNMSERLMIQTPEVTIGH